ncbi:hypothetical protein ACFL6X_08500 [Candidatus Latescibacterota bacterium]
MGGVARVRGTVTVGMVAAQATLILLATGAQAIDSPDELLARKLRTPMLTSTEGTFTGEGVCWHAASGAGDFVRGARQTGNLDYIDAGITYFDALVGKLHTSPDGYRGWVGPYMYDESVYADVHVGDAILVESMLALAEYVRTEVAPAPRPRYAEATAAYIDLAEHICEKWQARGTWREDGHYGGYISWGRFLTPEQPDVLQRHDVSNARLGLQFNKQQDMGIVHLRLYRLTGSREHRRKAVLIFSHTRSRLSLHDDYYTWNYWEPFYPGDVRSVDPPALSLWVNTHPYRDYQAGEVHDMVEAYHSGIVFTEEDMRRLVRTNLQMWNGDLEAPEWVNSNLAVDQEAVPGYEPPQPDGQHYTRTAGRLWGGAGPLRLDTGVPGRCPGDQHRLRPTPLPAGQRVGLAHHAQHLPEHGLRPARRPGPRRARLRGQQGADRRSTAYCPDRCCR